MMQHEVKSQVTFTSSRRCSFDSYSCLFCFIVLLQATLLCNGFSQDWDCRGSLCYKLTPQSANHSAADVICDLQGATLVNVTLDSEWNSTVAFSDALKVKDVPPHSLTVWTNLVFDRDGNGSKLLTIAGESVECESAACRALSQSVTAEEEDETWCVAFSVGNMSKLSLEDCAVEHDVVCEKGIADVLAEDDFTILGLHPELFAAVMIVLYIIVVSLIAVYWGTITDQKRAEEYEDMRGIQAEMFKRFPRLKQGDRSDESDKKTGSDETPVI